MPLTEKSLHYDEQHLHAASLIDIYLNFKYNVLLMFFHFFFVFTQYTHQLINSEGGESLDYRQDFKLRLDNICRKPVFDENDLK